MRDFETGIVYVNAGTTGAETHLPFGGWKQTGNGHREAGPRGARHVHRVEGRVRRLQRAPPARPDRQPVSGRDGGPADSEESPPRTSRDPGPPARRTSPSGRSTCARRSTSRSARAGIRAATKSLVRRETREVAAVDGISFEIPPARSSASSGPTAPARRRRSRCCPGLLYPTSGEARVLGHTPSKREREFLRRITMVMGNRNQLQWDLPALDSFELIRAIYRLPQHEFVAHARRADRAARPRRPRHQAGPQPVARGADEGRDLRRPAPSAAGPVPRRADDRPRRHRPEADPLVRRRVQPADRGDGPADEPLHGGRPGAVQAGHRHPPRPDPVRRRAGGPRRPVLGDQDDRRHAARGVAGPVEVRRGHRHRGRPHDPPRHPRRRAPR